MSVEAKAKNIKLIAFDVDGVLTDGGIIYDNSGMEIKRFNVKDGQIISHLRANGFIVGAITGRNSEVVKNRCEELKLDFHFHGSHDKLVQYNKIKEEYNLTDEEIAYIGDDIIDLPILIRCGLSAIPNDTRAYMKKYADYITLSKGGDGALRDLADFILDTQGILDEIIAKQINNKEDN